MDRFLLSDFSFLSSLVRRVIRPRPPHTPGTHQTPACRQIHRTLTSPPSLWPGRELRKYHYLLRLSWPPPAAIRLPLLRYPRSPFRGPGVPAASAQGLPIAQGTYLVAVYSIFKVQQEIVFLLTLLELFCQNGEPGKKFFSKKATLFFLKAQKNAHHGPEGPQ